MQRRVKVEAKRESEQLAPPELDSVESERTSQLRAVFAPSARAAGQLRYEEKKNADRTPRTCHFSLLNHHHSREREEDDGDFGVTGLFGAGDGEGHADRPG